MPAENDRAFAPARLGLALEAGRQQATHHDVRSVPVGLGQDDRELVATDPEGPIRAAQAGRDLRSHAAQEEVAGRVTGRVVDLLELVEVEEHQGERPAVADGGRPLPFDLLLEAAVVAQAGQSVEEGLGAGLIVGALERAQRRLEALGGLEHAVGEPDREHAEDARQRDDDAGRHEQRGAAAAGEAVHDRRRNRDRDREHRDQREEEAEPNQSQIGRPAQRLTGSGGLLGNDGLLRTVAWMTVIAPAPQVANEAPSYCREWDLWVHPVDRADDQRYGCVHPLPGADRARRRLRDRRIGRSAGGTAPGVGTPDRARHGRSAAAVLVPGRRRLGDAAPIAYVASNVAVLVAVAANLAIPGMPLVLAGGTANLAGDRRQRRLHAGEPGHARGHGPPAQGRVLEQRTA